MQSRARTHRNRTKKQDNKDRLIETFIIVSGFIFAGYTDLSSSEAKSLVGFLIFIFLFSGLFARAGHVSIEKYDLLLPAYRNVSVFFPLLMISFFVLNDMLIIDDVPFSKLIWSLVLFVASVCLTISIQFALMGIKEFYKTKTFSAIFQLLFILFFINLAVYFYEPITQDLKTQIIIECLILILSILCFKNLESINRRVKDYVSKIENHEIYASIILNDVVLLLIVYLYLKFKGV